MKAINTLKLVAHDSVDLDRLSYSSGDLAYDITNNTIRIMDGINQGGKKIATQTWASSAIAGAVANAIGTEVTNRNNAISTAIGTEVTNRNNAISTAVSSIPVYSLPQATNSVLGGVRVDNTTITANAGVISAANQTASLSFFNNVMYNTGGLAVKNQQIGATAALVLPSSIVQGPVQLTSSNDEVWINANQNVSKFTSDGSLMINGGGVLQSDPTDQNAVYLSDYGYTIAPNANIKVGGVDSIFKITYGPGNVQIWKFGYDGVLTAAGDITTTGNVTATNVTATAVTTTNDVTVGGNANISNKPTLPSHATNKKYVDTKALALSIAMS